MTLTEKELRFLTKTLRRRRRRDYITWWIMAAACFAFFFWGWNASLKRETFDSLFMLPMAFTLGTGTALTFFGWYELIREGGRRKLVALMLRLINNDPKVLRQLSAKHGLGDLSP